VLIRRLFALQMQESKEVSGRYMRLWLCLVLSLLWAPALAAGEATVIYKRATLIDGTGAPLKPSMAIITKGERIMAVRPAAALSRQDMAAAKIVSARGLYALPGLINSHVHLASPPDRKYALAMLRRDVYSGVTTVRDMAGDTRFLADLSRAARQGEIAAPDIYYAALMAGPEFFHDPRTAEATRGETPGQVPWVRAITGQTDLPIAVAEAHGTGATAIKIYADLPPELVRAITAEAHRQHMLVWAHAAVFPASPRDVIEAGADVVSHVCMLAYQASAQMPSAYHNRAPVEEEKFRTENPVLHALFTEMKRRGTILDATLYVYDVMWKVPNAQPKPYCSLPLAEKLAGEAHRAGVLISTGTDAPAGWKSAYPSLNDELEMLVDAAGFTPMEAIEASSRIGAMTVGQAREIGTIEPGKIADLVFTARNPLADIANLRSVVITVKRGTIYRRSDYKPITKDEVGDNQ
jgi:imidazolonepropionase-like amidohydrolase